MNTEPKMQPLYSVDHETRQSSYRREDDIDNAAPGEDTPLLHRFPLHGIPDRNPITTIIVTSLLSILVVGVVIGIYLLIVQNNSENVLPPVETALQLVSRSQWDPSSVSRPMLAMAPMRTSQVIVVQTDTDECHSTIACTNLLQRMQGNMTARYRQLPYNFLVSSNGQTYESLGWGRPAPMFPQYAGTTLLAFIGNFTGKLPSQEQMDEARSFFAEAVSQRHLDPHFIIIGKNTTHKPQMLFQFLRTLPQWSDLWSDA